MKPCCAGSGVGDPDGKLSEMLIEGFRPAAHSTRRPHYTGNGRQRRYWRMWGYLAAVIAPSMIFPKTVPTFGIMLYSTVTDLARLRGWSTSVPIMTAV